LATVITCGMVIFFKDMIDSLFTLAALPYLFLLCGCYLLLPTLLRPRETAHSWLQSFAMGFAQGIAVVPGLSRSGVTITTGRLTGMNSAAATDFSFLMSIPIILASLVYELLQGGTIQMLGFGNVILAFVTAFVSGIVAIQMMLNMTKKIDLRWFAVYLFVLGVGLLIWL